MLSRITGLFSEKQISICGYRQLCARALFIQRADKSHQQLITGATRVSNSSRLSAFPSLVIWCHDVYFSLV